ncbi:MAG: lipopolysaccharide biosynthesis protein [bacterium]
MTADRQKSSSLRGGVFWSLLSFVGSKALTFIATLVLARLLAPSEFGVLAAVLAFITLLELISDLGMKATVIYESEEGITRRVHTAFTLNLLFTAFLTVLAVLLGPSIADFFGAGSDTILFQIAALDLLLRGLGNIHDALLLRDMEFRRRMIPVLVSNLIRGVATILLAVAGLGASALVIGFIIGSAVWTVTLWIVKPFWPNLTIQRSAIRGIATYGGWASVLAVFAALTQRADVAVIGSALGARALGLYTIAQRLPELIVGNVTWNLSIVAFPALSQRRDQADGRLTDTTLNLIRYSALFGMTIGAGMAVLATPLVVVLFSEKWLEAGAIMTPLAIMYGLVCIVFPLGDTFKALGRQPTMVVVNAITLPIAVGAMLLAAPAGIVAVAWARLGVTAAQGVVWIVLISRVLDLRLATVAGMLRPACAAASGVALSGIAVRTALPEPSVGPLVLAALVSGIGGLITLRVFASREYAELHDLLHRRVLSTSLAPARWRSSPPIAPVEIEQTAELGTERGGPQPPP